MLAVVHRVMLALLVVGFYGVFWRQRGQTLGMEAWRLRVEREDGALLDWRDVVTRIGAGVLSLLPSGLGWLWILVDRDKRAWHDRLSHTRVVVLPTRSDALASSPEQHARQCGQQYRGQPADDPRRQVEQLAAAFERPG